MKTLRALALLVASLFVALPAAAGSKVILMGGGASATPGNTDPAYLGPTTITWPGATNPLGGLTLVQSSGSYGSTTQPLITGFFGASEVFRVTNAGDIVHGGDGAFTGPSITAMRGASVSIWSTAQNSPIKLSIDTVWPQATAQFQFGGLDAADTLTGTNTAQKVVAILPVYDQTGTAGGTDLTIFRKETALGSGAQKFISLQAGAAGTTEMFAIDNKGVITKSISAAITASATSVQGGSPLTSALNVITTCATAGDSVTLPAAAAGLTIKITNRTATSADVFPASGDSINAGAADAAQALATLATLDCYAIDATIWECNTLAR